MNDTHQIENHPGTPGTNDPQGPVTERKSWSDRLRSKRVVIPTIAAVAVIGVGSLVWASTASEELSGDELDRASSAAIEAAGAGTVTDSEKDDETNLYEIEVTKDDGSEVDVRLDEDFKVIGTEGDQNDDAGDNNRVEGDDVNGEDNVDADDNGPDADDRVLSQTERDAAEKAALAEIGDGTVTDVEASDDPGTAYDVEVQMADGTEWHVDLDSDFGVVGSFQDS